MRPTTADDNVFDFDALLHPGTVFETPKDVLDHPALTLAEKRAILASWASDASAIASCPSMRAPAGLKEAGIDRAKSWTRCAPWTVVPERHPVENPTVSVRPNVRPRREVQSLR